MYHKTTTTNPDWTEKSEGAKFDESSYRALLLADSECNKPVETERPTHEAATNFRFQQPQRVSGYCFLTAVIHIISYQYVVYTGTLLRPLVYPYKNKTHCGYVIFFQLLFILTLWSFIQCLRTDAGRVPPNWGFYLGDKSKRRRYCQVCNIWKPDRTHHCSACSRCVLNMDHHCPWINNCIGFYNRKFFYQLLCYALVSCLCVTVHSVIYVVSILQDKADNYVRSDYDEARRCMNIVTDCAICIMLLIAIALAFPLIPFLRFHTTLIINNSTTIENMVEVRRHDEPSRYDLGIRRNLEQVMGKNMWLWWLPVHTHSSRPIGDGARWRQYYLTAVEEDL